MLDSNQRPFPENPTCKNCLTRPCRRLFSGRVYPGKMIFVHRSEFVSLPCYRPVFKKDEESAEEMVLTDALAETMADEKKPVTITNSRWEHVDEDKKNNTPDAAAIDDEVYLFVDVTGVPEGSPVTFDIFDVSSDPPLRIATAKGSNQQGTARGTWKVEDPSEHGDDLKIEFEGIAKSKASERAGIHCVPKEPLGHIVLCVSDTISNGAISNAECVLRGNGKEYSGKTDERGRVSWDDIPLFQYTVTINVGSLEVEKPVFWKNNSQKVQNVRVGRPKE